MLTFTPSLTRQRILILRFVFYLPKNYSLFKRFSPKSSNACHQETQLFGHIYLQSLPPSVGSRLYTSFYSMEDKHNNVGVICWMRQACTDKVPNCSSGTNVHAHSLASTWRNRGSNHQSVNKWTNCFTSCSSVFPWHLAIVQSKFVFIEFPLVNDKIPAILPTSSSASYVLCV